MGINITLRLLLVSCMLFMVCACNGNGDGHEDADAADAPGEEVPDLSAPLFEVVAGSTRKICQVTGDYDLHFDDGVPNDTVNRFNLWGTDLGSSFEHGGGLWVLFGDTLPTPGTVDDPNHADGEAIAVMFESDIDPETECLPLDFLTFPDLENWYRSPVVPGVDLGTMNVPLDGISVGEAMFVWFSTDEMTRSVLAVSTDNAASFAYLNDVGDTYFVNISAVLVADVALPGLDPGESNWVLLFGGGEYRKSHVYLAAVPLGAFMDPDSIPGSTQFFSGLEEGLIPQWSGSEDDAVPVFETEHPYPEDGPTGCVGELSVHYNEAANAWMALYNCDWVRIEMRTAAVPWGPWSEDPIVVFDPCADEGYCHFIRLPYDYRHVCAMSEEQWAACDALPNPVQVEGFEGVLGSPYGPYVIERFSTGTPDRVKLYFLMSTWSPYTVVLMTTELRRL